MGNKTGLYVIGGVVILGLVILFSFFEWKEVPDIDQNESYDTNSKELYGLSAFAQIFENKLGKERIVVSPEIDGFEVGDSNCAVVIFSNREINLDLESRPDLEYLVSKGNDLFLFSSNVNINFEDLYVGSLQSNYIQDSIYLNDYSSGDTMVFDLNFQETIPDTNRYSGDYFWELSSPDSLCTTILTKDSIAIFQKCLYGDGNIYIHSLPILFTNIYSKQKDYLVHVNYVFQRLKNSKKIYITSMGNAAAQDSPLGVLLKNRHLASAYYLALVGLLVFVFFGAKRLQRPIPLIEPVTNTSLQYIDNLARLYENQNSNQKIVTKMRDAFYHEMSKVYYVNPFEENYAAVLSKRSKIDERLISTLLSYFNAIKGQDKCSDDQLININRIVNKIEQQKNDGQY